MTWVKLDDDFWMHPKVVAVGNEGAGVFARCLSYSGAYLLDGRVPASVALSIAGSKRVLATVVDVGLLQQLPSGDMFIRDYAHYNPLRDQVEHDREERRKRATDAANKRWNGHKTGSR